MVNSGDDRLVASLQALAPKYINRQRRLPPVIWLMTLWPIPIIVWFAYYWSEIPLGYPKPTYPFYLATIAMIWRNGRLAGAVTVVAIAIVEYPELSWQKWTVNVFCLSVMLMLRGRCGLDS
jgi:hypothetical protein